MAALDPDEPGRPHPVRALATVGALVGLNLMHVKTGFVTQAALVGLAGRPGLRQSVVAAALKLDMEGHLRRPAVIAPTPAAMPTVKQMSVAC